MSTKITFWNKWNGKISIYMAYIVTDQEIDSSSKDARRHRCSMRACHAPTNVAYSTETRENNMKLIWEKMKNVTLKM